MGKGQIDAALHRGAREAMEHIYIMDPSKQYKLALNLVVTATIRLAGQVCNKLAFWRQK